MEHLGPLWASAISTMRDDQTLEAAADSDAPSLFVRHAATIADAKVPRSGKNNKLAVVVQLMSACVSL